MNERVLIGCPINMRKEYCIDDFMVRCAGLTHQNKKFYFVDNSTDKFWHVYKVMLKYGVDVDYIAPTGKNSQYMLACQNKIRRKVIDEGFDYLLFLECDIFPPNDIIERLLAHNAPIVAAQYFIGTGSDTHLLKTEIEPTQFGKRTNRNIGTLEGYIEHGTGKTKSSFFGFGCALIHRNILDAIPFRLDAYHRSHSDTPFYFDLYDMGIEVAIDNTIVEHKNQAWVAITDHT